MPQTPSAIATFSPRQAGQVRLRRCCLSRRKTRRRLSQACSELRSPPKPTPFLRSSAPGTASSSAKADEDVAAPSQSASDEAVNNTADRNVASTAPTSNPAQFVPGGLILTLASCIPISGAAKDVSVSQNPGRPELGDAGIQAVAAALAPDERVSRNHGGIPITPAQDTKTGQSEVRSYETSGGTMRVTPTVRAEERMIAVTVPSADPAKAPARPLFLARRRISSLRRCALPPW